MYWICLAIMWWKWNTVSFIKMVRFQLTWTWLNLIMIFLTTMFAKLFCEGWKYWINIQLLWFQIEIFYEGARFNQFTKPEVNLETGNSILISKSWKTHPEIFQKLEFFQGLTQTVLPDKASNFRIFNFRGTHRFLENSFKYG